MNRPDETARDPRAEQTPRETANGAPTEDLAALVHRALATTSTAAVDLLWADQRARWERGERLPVEAYVAAAGQLPDDVVVDLVYGEWLLHQHLGVMVTAADYLRRFPHVADRLQRQWALEVAVNSEAMPTLDAGSVSADAKRERDGREGSRPAGEIHAHLPAMIGKYRVVARLDSGAQGDVYRAVHPGLQRDVVVKLARHVFPVGDPLRDRLPAEGRVLAELEHPGLARVYDLDFDADRPYLVMEFVRGCHLEQYARQRRVTSVEAARLVAAAARALHVAHSRGVLHLDLKPRNILVDERGQPRLIDFGLARCENAWGHSVVMPVGLFGTVAYMAPEQVRGDAAGLTLQSDLYALGGVLFFLLTGHAPREGDSFTDLLLRASRGEWNQQLLEQPEIPADLRRVCRRAMAFQRDQRYANAEELAADLEQFVTAAERGRNRWPVTALAGLVIVLTLVGGWWKWRTPAAPVPPAAGQAGMVAAPSVPTDLTYPVLQVRVWRAGQPPERFTDLAEAVPLRTGDELKVRADVPAGYHAALVAYNSTDGVRWLNGLEAEATERTLQFPKIPEQAAPMQGPPGTEVLLLVVRRLRPVKPDELSALWPRESSWAALTGSVMVALQPETLKLLRPSRGFGAPRDHVDPRDDVQRRLLQLGERLVEEFDYFELLAFPCESQ